MSISKHTPARSKILLSWIVGLVLSLGLAAVLWSRSRPASPPLPQPNGFDDLVRAAREVVGDPPAPGDPAVTASVLRAAVEANREPLRRARQGLTKECRVPLDFAGAMLQAHMDQMHDLRKLARLLYAEGGLAEEEGRTADAAAAYFDVIRLGQEAGRGGVMIDSLVGQAIEATGQWGLAGLRTKLDAGQLLPLIRALEAVERDRESVPTILAHERLWQRRTTSLPQQALLGLTGMGQKLQQPAVTALARAHARQQARLRLLLADLALRAYHRDHQEAPERLADLVPHYLAAVPRDPYGARDLSYKEVSPDFLLYCVGPDGQDDGGRPFPEKTYGPTVRGDVLVDPR